jgi:hypothetical protein
MNDRLLLPLRFDAAAMRADVAAIEASAWVEHYVKENYEGAWTVLPLRSAAGARHPIAAIYSDPSAEAFEDTPLLERCHYLPRVLASFACPLQTVRLMRLGPGSIIRLHADHDLGFQYGRARLHVPVVTNPDVEFVLDGERVVLGEGECWYLDLSRPHAVANRGAAARIHLVIDAAVNPWLSEQLAQGTRPGAEPRSPLVGAAATHAPAQTDLERLRAAVWDDPSLQERLRRPDSRDDFIAAALEVAGELGLTTSAAEIDQGMREARRFARQPA